MKKKLNTLLLYTVSKLTRIKTLTWYLSVFNTIDVYTGIQIELQPDFSTSLIFFQEESFIRFARISA